ncbi:hypothetical protein Aab01nite_69610 [Paractinoplanes abujensis]|nr:hypothetical protein Aab01nite_69610 [Actinoplanes abujensis]
MTADPGGAHARAEDARQDQHQTDRQDEKRGRPAVLPGTGTSSAGSHSTGSGSRAAVADPSTVIAGNCAPSTRKRART